MNKNKRRYFRPVRKSYRPLQPRLDPKRVKDISPNVEPEHTDDREWTNEEWERIWLSTSG